MKTVAMLSEPVASKELKDGVYEVWATAEAQYDDVPSELLVQLNSFVRPTGTELEQSIAEHPFFKAKKREVFANVRAADARFRAQFTLMRQQLEFRWNGRQPCRRLSRSERRRNRRRWWFEQMRRVVESAVPPGCCRQEFNGASALRSHRGEMTLRLTTRHEREEHEYDI